MASRSLSLPLESDAFILRIGKEINKLRAWEESSTSAAETISIGLSGIAELYKCIRKVLGSLQTREGCARKLLDGSSMLLETCNATRDIAREMKDASCDLRAALSIEQQCETSVASYVCSRKRIMKSAKQILQSMKRNEEKIFGSSDLFSDDGDRVSAVIQGLRCVNIISVSIHESLLMLLGSKPKFSGKTTLFSSLICKLRSAGYKEEEENANEMENVETALCGLYPFGSEEKVRLVRKRLEALETGMEGVVSGLDGVSKQLSHVRVSLLKIVSC